MATELATCSDCGGVIDEEHDGYEEGDEGKHADPTICVAHLKEKITAPHFGARIIAASLAESLKGAENFTEIHGTIEGLGDVVITLQKREGLTPGQKAQASDAEAKRVNTILARIVDAADMPEGVDPVAFIAALKVDASRNRDRQEQLDQATLEALYEATRMGIDDGKKGLDPSERALGARFEKGSIGERFYGLGFGVGTQNYVARKDAERAEKERDEARAAKSQSRGALDLKALARVLDALADTGEIR